MNMREEVPASHVFEPGRMVAVFLENEASGATLGYFGHVVQLDQDSVAKYPGQWQSWKYVVYIPQLNANYLIRAKHLIPTNQVESVDARLEPASELQFDCEPAYDNRFVFGRYRRNGRRIWSRFRFVKTDVTSPNFQISMPVSLYTEGACNILYSVPESDVLDRRYVIQGLQSVCGESDWREITPRRRT